MRLINVSTLQFQETFDPQSKPYAILSHAWHEGQEVSYQDWLSWLAVEPGWEAIEARSGFAKITNACQMARDYDLDYIWVDTNCIDKTSSAELSEAINSMYSWYASSQICFAYLSDVAIHGRKFENEAMHSVFKASRWFTRGWTLQELLAPRQVKFFSAKWKPIGTRNSLASVIEATTGIASAYLRGEQPVKSASVARRMSWAATRKTSRMEDMAYSLLGLFDINMPLLYGEGEKAFLRLQEEIIKVSTDQTIFAWEFVPEVSWASSGGFLPHPSWVSLLAPLPICFQNCGSTSIPLDYSTDPKLDIYNMTNLGLIVQLPLLATTSPRLFFAVLRAYQGSDNQPFCIPLIQIQNTFVRRSWPPNPLQIYGSNQTPVEILISRHQRFGRRDDVWESPTLLNQPDFVIFPILAVPGSELRNWATTAQASMAPDFGCVEIHSLNGDATLDFCALEFSLRNSSRDRFTALVGIDRRTSGTRYTCPLKCKLWDLKNGEQGKHLMDDNLDALAANPDYLKEHSGWETNSDGGTIQGKVSLGGKIRTDRGSGLQTLCLLIKSY